MNDFTKEELQIIHLDICVYINKSKITNVPQNHLDLRDKVNSMIENYCEHKWENTCCGCWVANICCIKCKKCLEEEADE